MELSFRDFLWKLSTPINEQYFFLHYIADDVAYGKFKIIDEKFLGMYILQDYCHLLIFSPTRVQKFKCFIARSRLRENGIVFIDSFQVTHWLSWDLLIISPQTKNWPFPRWSQFYWINCLLQPRIGVLHIPQVIIYFDNARELIDTNLKKDNYLYQLHADRIVPLDLDLKMQFGNCLFPKSGKMSAY